MKKNLFILFAIAGLLSTACVKPIEPEVPESKEPVFSLFVNGLETKAETKAGYKDGIGVIWSNIGDTEVETPIGLISAENHYQSSSVSVFDKDGVSNEQGYRVSFGFAEAPATGQYFAYQPYNGDSSNDAIKFTVAANQKQLSAGTMDVHDGSRLPCISTSEVTINGSETSNETSFKATAAILRFFVYDSNGNSEKIYSVKFKAKNPVAGTITCKNDGTKNGEVTDGGNEVKVVLNNLAEIKTNADEPIGMGIYLVALPCTTNGYTYEVETITGRYIFTSSKEKVLEAGKIYDVKLNLQKKTSYERRAPYFVGSTNPAHWEVPGDPAVNGPIPMEPVEGLDGVFKLDVDWGNDGFDFKFLAFNDRWDYVYLSHNTQEESTHDFYKNNIFDNEIVFVEKCVNDNKWRVSGYNCYPSVTYILDTKKLTLTCVPRLAVVGGNWENSGWKDDSSWVEFAEKPGHKMSIDPEHNRWYIDVTIPQDAADIDFKIFSHGSWGYEPDQGVWLKADGSHTWVGEKDSQDVHNAYIRNVGNNDDKWHLMTNEGVITGKVRISLDYSTWGNNSEAGKIYYERIQ